MHASHAIHLPERSPLWKVFWLYGVIPSNLLWIAVLWLMSRGGMPGATLGLLVFLLVYTAWIVTAVWRAAPRARDHGDRARRGGGARYDVVGRRGAGAVAHGRGA